jgi:hypothetical protein
MKTQRKPKLNNAYRYNGPMMSKRKKKQKQKIVGTGSCVAKMMRSLYAETEIFCLLMRNSMCMCIILYIMVSTKNILRN